MSNITKNLRKLRNVFSNEDGAVGIGTLIIFIAMAANMYTGAFLAAGCGQVITDMLTSLGLGPWGIFLMMLFIIFVLPIILIVQAMRKSRAKRKSKQKLPRL